MESRFVFFSPLMGFFTWPHKIWNRDSTKQRDEERTYDARKIFFIKHRPRMECPVELSPTQGLGKRGRCRLVPKLCLVTSYDRIKNVEMA